MKAYAPSFLFFILLLLGACVENNDPVQEGEAEVVIQTATRGSHQFLIRFEGDLFYPTNLPESFQVLVQDPIPVYIIFNKTGAEVTIFKPAPNDVPIFDRLIPEIRIVDIRRRD
ncbi:hypothetical protein [Belliella pelovolcani]|uniref:Uncharacterized protein n=1 Tax=Belliella pelovolcani TaxID=529505 RepID=A0A1N7MZR9_9BACT|nr:hypothetical protein [Belliella pelovolcani]SIS91644.1 hypothetical protein SAMN05421761_10827 [Belliella pelovolcani]